MNYYLLLLYIDIENYYMSLLYLDNTFISKVKMIEFVPFLTMTDNEMPKPSAFHQSER